MNFGLGTSALALLGIIGVAPLLPMNASAQNIVVVIADDIGVDGVGVYGAQPAAPPTPNIDALAAQGVLFRNAWTNPICSPSRASMLTGLYPAQHGVGWYIDTNTPELATGLDPNLPNLPKQLNLVGYRTVALGKYHVGDFPQVWTHPQRLGFDYYAGYLFGGVDYFNWPKTSIGTGPTGTIYNGSSPYTTTYATTDTANEAIAELNASGNEPFFLWVATLGAHAPYHVPPAGLHTYNLDGVPIAGNEPLYHKAIIEAVDSEIGRIMASVDLSDTTVIFIGDNGTPGDAVEAPFLPNHGKFTVYEGGVNVPLIVAGQAVAVAARGQESAALVQGTDLFETVLELAGAPGQTDASVSFVPYLSAPETPSIRAFTYADIFKPNGGPPDLGRRYQAARETRYKLHRQNTTINKFFDLQTDPWELSPLNLTSLTPEQQEAYDRLDLAILNSQEPSPPPAGDTCDDAQSVTGSGPFPVIHQVDTSTAIGDPSDPPASCGPPTAGSSVWYTFTPFVTGTATVRTQGSNYRAVVSAWPQAEGCGSLATELGCDDDTDGSGADLSFAVTAGTTYLVQIEDRAGSAGGALVARFSLVSSEGSPTMSFFATSIGNGSAGGNYGGLSGADARCQSLATTAGSGGKTWRAYLSTAPDGGVGALVHARDRIGVGPWRNFDDQVVGTGVQALHTDGLDPALVLDEFGNPVPSLEHDILTGSDSSGFALSVVPGFPGSAPPTCSNWTSNDSLDTAWVGHSDWVAGDSWNSSEPTQCDAAGLSAGAGSGRLYCFAVDEVDPPPAGDTCADAQSVPGSGPFPVIDQTDTSTALADPSDPPASCGPPTAGSSVWYTFTPFVTGIATVGTQGSDYGAVVSAWPQAEGCGFLATELGCDDDTDGSGADLSFAVHAGTTYLVQIEDRAGSAGGALVVSVPEPGSTLSLACAIAALGVLGAARHRGRSSESGS